MTSLHEFLEDSSTHNKRLKHKVQLVIQTTPTPYQSSLKSKAADLQIKADPRRSMWALLVENTRDVLGTDSGELPALQRSSCSQPLPLP